MRNNWIVQHVPSKIETVKVRQDSVCPCAGQKRDVHLPGGLCKGGSAFRNGISCLDNCSEFLCLDSAEAIHPSLPDLQWTPPGTWHLPWQPLTQATMWGIVTPQHPRKTTRQKTDYQHLVSLPDFLCFTPSTQSFPPPWKCLKTRLPVCHVYWGNGLVMTLLSQL